MFNDPNLLIIAIVAVTLGAALQSLAGFGIGVIAAPILVMIDPAFIPAPILMMGLVLSLLNTIHYRQQLKFGNIGVALLGRITGSLLAVMLLLLLPPVFFTLCFALFIMLCVFLSYSHFHIKYSPRNLLIGGFFSGLAGTTTSVGGPPIAMVYQNSELNSTRAELGLFFLIATLISLTLLLISGNFSYYQLQLTLPLLPAIFLGFGISLWLGKRFKPHYLKPAIALLSLTSSAIIVMQLVNDL
ncbi:sulfite exporter TauE/SafE family protein [Thalassotalea fonticola]|uniref:Probable membrane transporter protein n=1 Tax=Thalassotalea fonticola TaxID=3065649 RepID=A0ABZ0GKJ7_9GAMM|nr:sulfite exporter TauE/SafE family protein [Colwelliaceae bacterium S1-1]